MKTKHLIIFLLLAALAPWTAEAQTKTHIANTASSTQMTWDEFATSVNNGTTYEGETVYLDADITATTMAGTNENNCFKGTFEGQGHTLTFNYTASGSYYTAPFHYLNGATIQNLKVSGTITANYARCGGLAGNCYGTNAIINCLSDITINSTVNGDGTHGGFISRVFRGSTTFEGCTFAGSLIGENTIANGGFVGWSEGNNNYASVSFSNCIYAPVANTTDPSAGATFARGRNNSTTGITISNCFYNSSEFQYTQGKQAYTITGQSPATVAMNGTATNYNVSHITAYEGNPGLLYNGTIVAGEGDIVSLNLGGGNFYIANHGTFSGTTNPYTLTMDANNTIIAIAKTHIANTASSTQMTWDEFAQNVNDGITYEGETVYLDADITATTRAGYETGYGTSSHDIKSFQGTFDGQGHTITFNYTANSTYAAPFAYVKNATFLNLKTAGTITANTKRYAGGIAGMVISGSQNCTFTNCESNVTITSTSNGTDDCRHGGFVANVVGGNVTFNGCAFTGGFSGTNAKGWGGFVGYFNHYVYFTDCIFSPTSISINNQNNYTFARPSGTQVITFTNCYYTQSLGGSQGKQLYTVTAQSPATVAMNGTATNHNVSHITAYEGNQGLLYNGTIVAGEGDNVSLNLGGVGEYHTDHGTLSGTANPYTLTMDANNTIIFAVAKNHIARTSSSTQMTWAEFANTVNSGTTYVGMTVYLDEDITATTMAGTNETKCFKGTFDGQGHTLTFNYTASGSWYTAPFRYLNGATIQNLKVNGTITANYARCGGLAGHCYGNNTIINCLSDITINSSISGDGTHGGFVSVVRTGTTTFYSCAFTGKLLGSSTYKCGGFTGCTVSTVVFNDCVFDPTEITMGRNNSATLSRLFDDNATALYNNCYYTNDFNDGTHYLQQGGQPYTITGQGPVTVTLYGTATNHNVSHITNSYDTFGMYYNGTLIAQSSIYVVLNLGGVGEFHTDHGTLSGSANPYYLFMDAYNTTISITPCIYPDNLQCTAFDANTATLAWEELGTECGTPFTWQICLNGDEDNLITADSNPFTLTGLIPDLQYSAKVRADYGNQQTVWSNEIGLMLPVTLPYATDFETGSDWMLLNGDCANQWYRGTATSHGGTHGLYISNDGGATNAYNNTVSLVFAAKTFNFEAGTYVISYDWRANGQKNYDFLRVALVPASANLTPLTTIPYSYHLHIDELPNDWIAVDGGRGHNLATEWQTEGKEIEITEAGAYKLVFAWRNSTGGNNPPAAIDNVSIAPASCLKPSDAQCTDFTVTTATISWTDNSDASAWQISLNDDESYLIDATTNPFTLSGLDGNASYSVKVRANCGDDGYSVWTDPFTVNTDQYAVGTGPHSSFHNDWLPIYVYSNYSLSQQIYTPEELGDAGTIESIAFYMWNGPQRLWRRPLRIYMKYTDINDYGDSEYVSNAAFIPVTNADLVRIGNGTAGDTETFYLDQWGTVHFDQPFEYDGQHNVVITVYDHFGDYFHTPPTFQQADFFYYVTSTQQAISSYQVNNVDPMDLVGTNTGGFLAHYIKNYVKIGKTYPVPGNLQVVKGISGNSASISWTENGTATAWQLCINGEEHNPIETSSTQYLLTGLTPGTSYTVQVRSRCDGDFFSGWSDAITFTTLPGSYSTDFETACDWTLVNGGLTNAWVWGTAAHNGEGTHGLYISNDGGTTNAYTNTKNTMVYATTRAYVFNDDIYRVSYDWRAFGENRYDYLRVALVPDTVMLEAGTTIPSGFSYNSLPSGWIALDGGGKLNQSTEWQTASNDVWVPAGVYKMVFAWRNDYSTGNNPPAAIDNVSVVPVACPTPVNFAALNVANNAAQLGWNGPEAIDSYTVRYRATRHALFMEDFEDGLTDWTLIDCNYNTGVISESPYSGNNSFNFHNNLAPPQYLISPELLGVTEGMKLEFYYRNKSTNYPETFHVGFSSTDNATDSFTFGDEITVSDGQWHFYSEFIPAGTKYICWKHTSNDHYQLYIDDIEVGTDIPAGEWQTTTVPGGSTQVSVTLGLTPVTTYEAQVKSDCDDAEWSETITFTTPPIAPVDLQCTAVTAVTASLSWNCEVEMDSYTVRYRETGSSIIDESFEHGLNGWMLRDCEYNTGVQYYSAYSGYVCFGFGSSDNPPQYLISPELSGGTEGMKLEFYYRNESNHNPETFHVGFSSTDNATGSFTFGDEITAADGLWHLYSALVPAGTKYICLKRTSNHQSFLYIDNISVSVDLPPGEWQTVAATTTNVTLTGLAYGTRYEAQVKGDNYPWSEPTTFNTPIPFPTPFDLQCTTVTASTADLHWNSEIENENFTVRYRTAVNISQPVFSEGFENGLGDWTLRDCDSNTGVYSGLAHSGLSNFCFGYSTNPPQYLISPELSGVTEGMKLEFYYRNYSSSDPETFHVGFSSTDNATDSFTFGDEITASDTQWHLYRETIPAGTKYICWKYTAYYKFLLFIDDIVVGTELPTGEWQTATTTTTSITLTGLIPNTPYEAQVKGNINGGEWSEMAAFLTLPSTVTQTLTLSEGWNWVSLYVEGDPIDLLQALESALAENATQISSAELFTENDEGDWWGDLDEEGVTNEQMYMILVENACTITLQGNTANPANPADHAITINPGWNWIGFPCDHEMTIEEALGGFDAEDGDVFANSENFTEFDGEWFGDVETLLPGQGFMYFSNSNEPKTLIIGSSKGIILKR